MAGLEIEKESTRRKNEELNQALREKTRKHMMTQELYDKLKRRTMLGQVQNAAVDAVDETIQQSVTASRYADAMQNQNMRPPPPPAFPNGQTASARRTSSYSIANMGPPAQRNRGSGDGHWRGGFGGPPSSRIHTPFPST